MQAMQDYDDVLLNQSQMEVVSFWRKRHQSITDCQAEKLTHCHAGMNDCFQPKAGVS